MTISNATVLLPWLAAAKYHAVDGLPWLKREVLMGSIYFGGPMDYNMAVYNVYAKIAENPVGQAHN